MRNTFARSLLAKAMNDPSIILITGDLGYGVLDEFSQKLPDQYINSGINEQSMMGMAAGLASQGFRPFVYSIANFPTFRALEQIRNDVCYMKNPVTIVSVGAGLGYGPHGYSHHAVEDLAVMRVLPGMRIFSPADPFETEYCLERILLEKSPAYLRLGKGGEGKLSENFSHEASSPFVHSLGKDGTICWTGGIGSRAHAAKKLLADVGISVNMISVPEISDEILLRILNQFGALPILTLEEHILNGGFGSWILEVANTKGMPTQIKRMGIPAFTNNLIGSQEYLIDASGMSPQQISSEFVQLLKSRA